MSGMVCFTPYLAPDMARIKLPGPGVQTSGMENDKNRIINSGVIIWSPHLSIVYYRIRFPNLYNPGKANSTDTELLKNL